MGNLSVYNPQTGSFEDVCEIYGSVTMEIARQLVAARKARWAPRKTHLVLTSGKCLSIKGE
jgi:hypothetical protein